MSVITETPAAPPQAAEPRKVGGGLLDPKMLWKSTPDAFKKLDPRVQIKNPVMFVVEVGSLLTLYTGFTLGTLYCAFAPNYALLLVARVMTGAFGGVAAATVLASTTSSPLSFATTRPRDMTTTLSHNPSSSAASEELTMTGVPELDTSRKMR